MTAEILPFTQTPETETTPLPAPAEVLEWLRKSPAGRAHRSMLNRPRKPAPAGLVADMQNGELSICSYSHSIALVIKGDTDFIERFYTFALNTCVIGATAPLNWYLQGHEGSVAYVCPITRRHILRGLAYQFRAEIMRTREIPPVSEHQDDETGTCEMVWDDRAVNRLAVAKARAFLREHVKRGGGLLSREKVPGAVYDQSPAGRAERWDEAA